MNWPDPRNINSITAAAASRISMSTTFPRLRRDRPRISAQRRDMTIPAETRRRAVQCVPLRLEAAGAAATSTAWRGEDDEPRRWDVEYMDTGHLACCIVVLRNNAISPASRPGPWGRKRARRRSGAWTPPRPSLLRRSARLGTPPSVPFRPPLVVQSSPRRGTAAEETASNARSSRATTPAPCATGRWRAPSSSPHPGAPAPTGAGPARGTRPRRARGEDSRTPNRLPTAASPTVPRTNPATRPAGAAPSVSPNSTATSTTMATSSAMSWTATAAALPRNTPPGRSAPAPCPPAPRPRIRLSYAGGSDRTEATARQPSRPGAVSWSRPPPGPKTTRT